MPSRVRSLRDLRDLTRCLCVLAALLLAACDQGAGDLIQEIDAARQGCTEDRLRAGSEECVQMFERYAEMGTDAIETYIGALRALDEAVQRRDGTNFDTTGLGRALTAPRGVDRNGTGGQTLPPASRSDPYSAQPQGGWESFDPATGGGYRGEGVSPTSGAWPRPADDRWADPSMDRRAAPAAGGARGEPLRRGSLLPPEQRLQRPWLDGESDAPVDDPRGLPNPGVPVGGSGGWSPAGGWDPRAQYLDPRTGYPGAQYDPRHPFDPRAQYDSRYPYDPRYQYDVRGQYDPRYPYDPRSGYGPGARYDPRLDSSLDPRGGYDGRDGIWRSGDPYDYPPPYPR